ncbi:RepB family plasmid replication initiator protein [Pseudogracilibacillus auburnensis]|uniref:RepB family plasmid replication initiator protein n=1 Tax=Pseudogracilibacillus auburnensis TaxID=1494959 RepID=UPI000D75B7FE|nr:RepB family plasmid replication initiator protein [Pseudogracilibacillus auburnensis]MBO1001630.1 RepB family plasmid replication initiator protein [Pseudogracilibacillus auburnensis]
MLQQMLGVGDKYKQYGQFKLRVLQQAKKELDKKESLTFSFDEINKAEKLLKLY